MRLNSFIAAGLPVIEVENVLEETVPVTTTNTDNTLVVVIIIATIVAIIAVMAIVVLICMLSRQKKVKKLQSSGSCVKENRVVKQQVVQNERTHITQSLPKQSGRTQHLWGTKEDEDKQIFLYLMDVMDTSRSFRAVIDTQVVIGRKEGNIIISEDRSLSKCHCRIIRRGSVYSLEDLNSSNGTRYNGQLVQGETAILPGGIIEIGRQRLRMEIKEVTR